MRSVRVACNIASTWFRCRAKQSVKALAWAIEKQSFHRKWYQKATKLYFDNLVEIVYSILAHSFKNVWNLCARGFRYENLQSISLIMFWDEFRWLIVVKWLPIFVCISWFPLSRFEIDEQQGVDAPIPTFVITLFTQLKNNYSYLFQFIHFYAALSELEFTSKFFSFDIMFQYWSNEKKRKKTIWFLPAADHIYRNILTLGYSLLLH